MPANTAATADVAGDYVRDDHWAKRLILHADGRYDYSSSQSGFAGGQGTGHTGRWKLLDTGDVELHVRERFTAYEDMDDYDFDRTPADEHLLVRISRDPLGRVHTCTFADRSEPLELTRHDWKPPSIVARLRGWLRARR